MLFTSLTIDSNNLLKSDKSHNEVSGFQVGSGEKANDTAKCVDVCQ